MTMILTLVEQNGGELNSSAPEALTLARSLSQATGKPLAAVLLGASAAAAAPALAPYGVEKVYHVVHDGLDAYAPEAWARSVAQLMAQAQPEAVVAAGTDRGNELMAHVAAMTDLPFAANVTEVQPGSPYYLTRVRWGGSLLEEAELEGSPALLSVAQHALQPQEAASPGPATVETFTPELDERAFRVRASEQVASHEAGISLADAPVVVGGGRGVGSEAGFALLEELAALLDGAVGGSRVVTNLGWRPHADQIGQTGTRIAPDLYIACGISGAIQHMVGARGSKRILAINSDPEAPIMAKADYAVVGDLHQVLPAVIAEIKKAKGL
ncbi:MAG: electron transfer flavoprotein subunit alpha/FixB family protein [Anaerolineae bacterium]|nr:electron transfer flavoprotein subunit alpha/FixB family protein [Anaerolineae bacterium]